MRDHTRQVSRGRRNPLEEKKPSGIGWAPMVSGSAAIPSTFKTRRCSQISKEQQESCEESHAESLKRIPGEDRPRSAGIWLVSLAHAARHPQALGAAGGVETGPVEATAALKAPCYRLDLEWKDHIGRPAFFAQKSSRLAQLQSKPQHQYSVLNYHQ